MSKSEEAFRLLRRDILDARLPPDAPLTIASLKERYGLGWTPLREALPRLEAERLVVFSRHKGYRVAGVSETELRDLQKARESVETTLLADSIAYGDADWEARVVAAHHRFSLAPPLRIGMPADEVELWEVSHEGFHMALLSAGRSDWLMRFAVQITDQLHRHHRNLVLLRAMDEVAEPDPDLSAILETATGLDHHTRLMRAALDRDTEAAHALLVEHIGFTRAAYEVAGQTP